MDIYYVIDFLLVYYIDVDKVWLYYIPRVFMILILLSNCFIILSSNGLPFRLIIYEIGRVAMVKFIMYP